MKTLFLSLLLSSTFLMSEAKHRREKNDTTTTNEIVLSQGSTTQTMPGKSGPGKDRTLRTGLIMMGSGVVGTIAGGGLLSYGIAEDTGSAGAFFGGLLLVVGGVSSTLSGAVVTIVGLAMPRN